MRIKSILLFAIGLTSSVVNSQVREFSLEDAKAYALENHLNIINAQHDVSVASQQIRETMGMGLPQVDITGAFNHFINIPVSVVDAQFFNPLAPEGELVDFQMGTEYNASGNLQVNQLLFNGSYIVGLKASKHVRQYQLSNLELTKEDVVFNVIQAYQMAAVAKTNLTFADSIVYLAEDLIEKQQNYLDLGLILDEDMAQMKYSLLSAKNAQTSAQIQFNNALALLKYTMGIDVNADISITDQAENLINKSSVSEGDIHNNIQYSLIEQSIELAKLDLQNNKMANIPSLYAFFSQTYNAYRNEFNFFADERWFPQTVWGLQLNIPVFSGLQRHAKIQQNKIKVLKSENTLNQMERTLQFQEIQVQNKLIGAKSKYQLQKENTEIADMIYRNAITKKELGKDNAIIVTQKHNQLLMAQAQYIASLIELFEAQLEKDKLYNKLISNN